MGSRAEKAMSGNGLSALQARAHAVAVAKGWHAPEKQPPHDVLLVVARLGLIHSEVSEALEEVRSGRPLLEVRHRADGKPEGFATELADIIIRVLDLAGAMGMDLEAVLEEKMRFNATRPERHGGKVV